MIFRLLKCNSCPGVIALMTAQLHDAFEIQKGEFMKHFVHCWHEDKDTESTIVYASNHKKAAKKSGFLKPGNEISVDKPGMLNVRYRVDKLGRLRVLSCYGNY